MISRKSLKKNDQFPLVYDMHWQTNCREHLKCEVERMTTSVADLNIFLGK